MRAILLLLVLLLVACEQQWPPPPPVPGQPLTYPQKHYQDLEKRRLMIEQRFRSSS